MLRFFSFCLVGYTLLVSPLAVGQDTEPATEQPVTAASSMEEIREALMPFEPPADRAELPAATAELFAKMKQGTEASAKVFAGLSAEQLNFRPANGSHTPRWNAEHNSATQLLFFSQIYNAVDSRIPVMKWMPKQMPDDYQAAHPNWDGKQEAAKMLAVDEFCQRYAYLIADVDLDAKPENTFWPSYRALLMKMPDHMAEHTANVKKKFDAEGWPE